MTYSPHGSIEWKKITRGLTRRCADDRALTLVLRKDQVEAITQARKDEEAVNGMMLKGDQIKAITQARNDEAEATNKAPQLHDGFL